MSDVLRQKFETSDGSSIKICTRGKDLKIKRPLKSVSKALFSTRSVSSDEVDRFQSTLGLSLKQTEKALVFFRSWKGRDSVQSGVMGALRDADKQLESYYSITELSLDSSVKGEEKVLMSIVFCHDLRGLIDNVIEHRGGSVADYMIKTCIDGGDDFLKFTMNVMKRGYGGV
ncbi:hypothetical protein SNE40_009798 [Patella caerulea]|uniref:Uncharacterized protein n=1 Tax=Patella caerulea TaxID=87958 RepID=A0AAN8JUS7_PATCE